MKDKRIERVLSILSLFLSLSLMYIAGRDEGSLIYCIVAILFGISAIVSAGILD